MSSPSDRSGVIAPPPILFFAVFVAAILLDHLYSLKISLVPAAAQWWGMVLIDCSGILALWAAVYMWKVKTPINPLRPTTALVTSGPYRFSRNPLSVSLIILYVGLALRLNTFWPLLLLPPLLIVFHYGVIRREERYLEGKFGDAYRNYCSAVRRWI